MNAERSIEPDLFLEQVLGAHFPGIGGLLVSVREASENATQARATLLARVSAEAGERFSATAGWQPQRIAECCETHLDSILDGDELDLKADPRRLVWGATPIFDPHPAQDGAGYARLQSLRDWASEASCSAEADAYRDACDAVEDARAHALAGLAPGAHGKASGCPICFPRRTGAGPDEDA
jgi:hypothetical protein